MPFVKSRVNCIWTRRSKRVTFLQIQKLLYAEEKCVWPWKRLGFFISDLWKIELTFWTWWGSCQKIYVWPYIYTVKSRFKNSPFNKKSRFKVWNLVTEMKFLIKKSRFSEKSRFKECKWADGGHSLNRDFTVYGVRESWWWYWTKVPFLCVSLCSIPLSKPIFFHWKPLFRHRHRPRDH